MFIGYLNLPNIMTLTGLILAVLACFFSFHGNLGLAMTCLMAAGIIDLFDGLIARKIKRRQEDALFGAQLDSLSDMACFGMAPVFIAIQSGLNTFFDFILMAIYACCAAMRLAYFNIHGTTSGEKGLLQYYTGLPVTYAALIFPVAFIFRNVFEVALSNIIIRLTFAFVALSFVSKIKILKPKGIFYIIFPTIAGALSIYWLLRTQ